MSDALPRLDCVLNLPKGAGTKVGDMFSLTCRGPLTAPVKESVQFLYPSEELKHVLKFSRVVHSAEDNFELEVYSHKAGRFENLSFTLTDEAGAYRVENLNFEIASVLQQGEQMHPPFGPASESYPLWFWLLLAAAALTVLLFILRFNRRRRERQQLVQSVLGEGRENIPFRELVKIQNAQAFNQYSRDMRAVQKKLAWQRGEAREIWDEIEKAFRLYLVRELLTPAFAWSRRRVLKDIKRYHPRVYENCKRDLAHILQEFDKGQGQPITLRDCEQMYQLSRTVTDAIYQARRGRRSA